MTIHRLKRILFSRVNFQVYTFPSFSLGLQNSSLHHTLIYLIAINILRNDPGSRSYLLSSHLISLLWFELSLIVYGIGMLAAMIIVVTYSLLFQIDQFSYILLYMCICAQYMPVIYDEIETEILTNDGSCLQLCELSFDKTRHLRNPFNENLPVKVLIAICSLVSSEL